MPDTDKISDQRKSAFNLGGILLVIGLLLFFCPFVTVPLTFFRAANSSPFDPHETFITNQNHAPVILHQNADSAFKPVAVSFGLAFIGFVLILVGGIIRTTAARGLAGAGVILDPEQAREDLKPWNKAAGAMMQDSLEELPIVHKLEDAIDKAASSPTPSPLPIVKVRCRACKTLNEEDAKFCKNCAAAL